ncbi:MAG: cytochrome c-type biogenesis protein CcmH, partial [Bacteroidetes bacterium]|nr:cytochrome c-type biogenesis protein CcmH [Bacteroidota bacterium]
QQGESREEILQYFVDRYGEGILRDPPSHGFNLALWVLPVLGLIVGFGISLRAVYGRRSRRAAIASAEPSDLVGISEEELARYERQLDEDLRP